MFYSLQNPQIFKRLFLAFFAICLLNPATAQLAAGPMVGAVDFKEVKVWLQTEKAQTVFLKYRLKGTSLPFINTETITTSSNNAFTAVFIADRVQPGCEYEYEVFVGNKKAAVNRPLNFKTQTLWQYRMDPPEFSFLAGSCVYINDSVSDRPGKPYGGDYGIFNAMANHDAGFMLWLGDNTYYREVDWNTRTGMLYRNSHTRKLPELQPLLSKMAHYAIWDDHDFGPNNSDRSFWNKELSRDVFSYFWANPSYGLPQNGGITSMFTWNDVEVFLLDNRYFRSVNERKSGGRTILGAVQLEWLKDALASSTAPFKFVAMGGQLLSDARKYEMYSNYGFDAERAEIIKFIQEEGIKGVIFINGDRHHTELSVLKEENKPTIYDLTVSPLTSGSHFSTEVNNLRVPETYVAEQNYAEIFVKGAFKKRYVEVVVRDKTGKKLWEKRLDP